MRLSISLRKVYLIFGTLIISFFIFTSSYASPTLWYNGDFDGVDGLPNRVKTLDPQSNIYDDFIVSATGWNVYTIWSNNLMNFTGVTQAMWEIRSGVSSGDGGTLIANGTSAATQIATGRNGYGYDEYKIEVGGLNIYLPGGTYWLTVAPVGFDSGHSFVSTTSGANAFGNPAGNNQNAYINRPDVGYFFELTSDIDPDWTYDFSMGVGGQVVPEPASLTLLGLGLLGLAGWRKKGRG